MTSVPIEKVSVIKFSVGAVYEDHINRLPFGSLLSVHIKTEAYRAKPPTVLFWRFMSLVRLSRVNSQTKSGK